MKILKFLEIQPKLILSPTKKIIFPEKSLNSISKMILMKIIQLEII